MKYLLVKLIIVNSKAHYSGYFQMITLLQLKVFSNISKKGIHYGSSINFS